MSTPEDESFVSDGTHSAGTAVQWGTPQDHAACNDAIRAAAASGARDALLSLAAEYDTLAAQGRREDVTPEQYRYGRGILQAVAEIARQRAQPAQCSPSGSPGLSLDTREGQERTDDLRAADAYMAGVKAERERCAVLAEDRMATYDLTKPCGCGRTHPGTGRPCTALIRSGQPFADLIREGTDDT